MPKIGRYTGPSIDGVSAPSEDEYSAAMERHGTDEWTEEDAETQARYTAYQRQRLAHAANQDLHAAPAGTVEESPLAVGDRDPGPLDGESTGELDNARHELAVSVENQRRADAGEPLIGDWDREDSEGRPVKDGPAAKGSRDEGPLETVPAGGHRPVESDSDARAVRLAGEDSDKSDKSGKGSRGGSQTQRSRS